MAGLAAWFFAATVTFGAGFGPNVQIVLGYVGGGLRVRGQAGDLLG